ncbi:HAD hydrolase family protein [Terriglobus saanensis]|nr:HAD family hydrolase [Terriglobus saanensis]
MKPKIIVLDMDGTLVGAEGKVSERNVAALDLAAREGVLIAIATGRRHSYAMKILRTLALDGSCPIMSSNGAVTRTFDSRLLHRTFLDRETALWLCTHLVEYRNALVLTFDKVGEDGEDGPGALVVEELDNLHQSINGWMVSNAPWIEAHVPITRIFDDPENMPIQAMLCGNLERMRAAEKLLLAHEHVISEGHTPAERIHTARVAVHRTEYPARDLCMVDLLPAGCSKGAALRQLCQDHGVSPEETVAIGDNWNDVSLFEVAGRSVVMGNAPEDLQEMAQRRGWIVGRTNLDDGVAIAIEGLLGS